MIKESLNSAIQRILDENYVISEDIENSVLSESASSAISKIADNNIRQSREIASETRKYLRQKRITLDDNSEEVDNRDSETLEEAVSMNPRDLISKVSTLLRDLPKHTFLGINLANLVKNSKVYKFGDKTEIDNETYRWSDIITMNVPTPKTKILSSAKFSYVKEFKFNNCWVDIIEKEKAEKGDAIGLRFTFDGELKIDEDFTHNLQDVGDAFRQVIEDGRTLIPKNSKPIGFKAKLKDFIKTIMNKDVLWDGWHYTKAVGGDYNVRSGDYIRGGSDFDQMWADSPIAYEDKGDGVYKFCLCLSYRTPGRFGDYRDN